MTLILRVLFSTVFGLCQLLGAVRPNDVPLGRAFRAETVEKVLWSATKALHIAQMALEGLGLQVTTHLVFGNPSAEIVRVVQEAQVHLIVLGAKGGGVIRAGLWRYCL